MGVMGDAHYELILLYQRVEESSSVDMLVQHRGVILTFVLVHPKKPKNNHM